MFNYSVLAEDSFQMLMHSWTVLLLSFVFILNLNVMQNVPKKISNMM